MNVFDVTVCILSYTVGTIFAVKLLVNNGLTDFLQSAHYYSLAILLVAGVLSWIAMVWMLNPNEFKVNNKQRISLGVSIVISILMWGRYAFTIAENQTK